MEAATSDQAARECQRNTPSYSNDAKNTSPKVKNGADDANLAARSDDCRQRVVVFRSRVGDVVTRRWRRWETCLFRESDPSSLAVFRISFGLLMLLDIPHERGLATADTKWANSELCHFPLIDSLAPLPYEWMCLVYAIMWAGALGITLGYHFRVSCACFNLTYWYVVLLDKSSWNNHTYLYGLFGLLLLFSRPHVSWSLDRKRGATWADGVPAWNYSVLRFQTFILYFMAGLKKMDWDWLNGYSMKNLSDHWVFAPFRLYFTGNQVDLWIVHVCGFLIDAFAGFGLQFAKTRPITLTLLFAFHFMNSRMFQIGVFPYVGIVSMFVFCDSNWPKTLLVGLRYRRREESGRKRRFSSDAVTESSPVRISPYQRYVIVPSIILYAIVQLILPYSHYVTKGYNGWTNGLYGYSWDMMVHSWDNSMSVIKAVDNANGAEYFLNAHDWVLNDKWMKHPDMLLQFARCAERNLKRKIKNLGNVSITVDFWFSLNGRFHQRMFDPRVDLLTAEWSPFEKVSWLMPLLSDLSDWRAKLQQIRDETYGRANDSRVIFVADFPGLVMENYVNEELTNVTLSLLKGRIEVNAETNESVILNAGESTSIRRGVFHRIRTISKTPSCYMYTYYNGTSNRTQLPLSPSPIAQVKTEIRRRFTDMIRSIHLVVVAISNIIRRFLFSSGTNPR